MGFFGLFTGKNAKPAYQRPVAPAPAPAAPPSGTPAVDLYSFSGTPSDYFYKIITGCLPGYYEVERNVPVAVLTGEAPSGADTWRCACGCENTGKFCSDCGSKKPEPKPAPTSDKWRCACGCQNTGKFCCECGAKRPDPNQWVCHCGTVNKGKFCADCGSKKPQPKADKPKKDGVPIDFLLKRDGEPLVAIILCPKSKYGNLPYRITMEKCADKNITCLRFMNEFRNEAAYVIRRINTALIR